MKLKTLKKKIRKLEARLVEGPAKLVKLKRKLETAIKAAAIKARKKTAARAGRTDKGTKSLTPVQKKTGGVTARPPVAAKGRSAAKKGKRKLNLSPERRAALASAMKARWTAKRAAEGKQKSSPAAGASTHGQVAPAES